VAISDVIMVTNTAMFELIRPSEVEKDEKCGLGSDEYAIGYGNPCMETNWMAPYSDCFERVDGYGDLIGFSSTLNCYNVFIWIMLAVELRAISDFRTSKM
jgi:hypothetical protein